MKTLETMIKSAEELYNNLVNVPLNETFPEVLEIGGEDIQDATAILGLKFKEELDKFEIVSKRVDGETFSPKYTIKRIKK